jgi:hypothetical protein
MPTNCSRPAPKALICSLQPLPPTRSIMVLGFAFPRSAAIRPQTFRSGGRPPSAPTRPSTRFVRTACQAHPYRRRGGRDTLSPGVRPQQDEARCSPRCPHSLRARLRGGGRVAGRCLRARSAAWPRALLGRGWAAAAARIPEPAARRVPSYRHGAYCQVWRGADRFHRSQWRRLILIAGDAHPNLERWFDRSVAANTMAPSAQAA